MSDRVTVRASSWADLADCPLRWAARYFMGIEKPSSPRAHLGTAIHAAAASVDNAQMNEVPYAPADVADIFHGAFSRPDYEVDWRFSGDDVTAAELEVTGLRLIDVYAREWSPRFEFVAVEKQINGVEFETSSGVTIELTGKMDRARIVQPNAVGYKNGEMPTAKLGGPAKFPKQIMDMKTGKRAVAKGQAVTKGHKAQLGVYEIIEEHESGEACGPVSEIIGLKTSGKPEIATGTIRNAKDIMLGEDGLIEQAGKMFKSGLYMPNPSSRLCDARYCVYFSRCKYGGSG